MITRRVALTGLILTYLVLVVTTGILLAYLLDPLLVVVVGFILGSVYGVVLLEILHYIYTGRRIAPGWFRRGAKELWRRG